LKLTARETGLTVDLATKSVSEWRTIAAMKTKVPRSHCDSTLHQRFLTALFVLTPLFFFNKGVEKWSGVEKGQDRIWQAKRFHSLRSLPLMLLTLFSFLTDSVESRK